MPIHDRQILALGAEGQKLLKKINVAIVGLGGMGSMVAQQLVYLGVRDFTLVDFDHVEMTNLNRLVGAKQSDLGRLKVDVAARMIKAVSPESRVRRVGCNVRGVEALNTLKTVDFIFGCVDSDSARLILNDLALAYCIAYIDTGVGIEADEGRIADAGGRVIVWTPGRPCLLCAGEINPRIAAEELESEEQREFRRQHGYVAGADVVAPSVISLNGTVASIAVTELLGLLTGVKKPNYYTYYDLLEQRVGPRIVKANEKCVACATVALGDRANIERYSKTDLPSVEDLPLTEAT
jgi:molybdopterin/thiamine biosynthesis adenylyltransferase